VVVLGGGSAGWLCAATLAAEFGSAADSTRPLDITLIESPDLPSIGVGEGTWPSMRSTLHRIGLSELDLVRECDASFKQGSRFDGWVDASAGDRYYHPFTLPHGWGEVDLAAAWLCAPDGRSFADAVCPQVQICDAALAPKQLTSGDYGAAVNYGYHFDAVKVGLLLARHARENLGVQHVLDEVVSVRCHENGDIATLVTRTRGEIEGDLFIDCSGLASRLIGQHFGVGLRCEQGVLFNDAALAVQVPYADANAPLASATIATAHGCGWTWDIGLPTRRGVGLVFSSHHASHELAERTLRAYLERTGASTDELTPRLIRFSPGYRERFWVGNCVAVGLSAGFIEPLEASALALVELSVGMIRDDMPATREDMDIVARRFNETFAYRWARIIDFLKLHYVLSRREDSDYWRDHRRDDTLPDSLRELLQLWRHRAPSRYDFTRNEEVFPSASYQYVLYGMQHRPDPALARPVRPQQLAAAQAQMAEAARTTRRLLGALPRHRDLLQHLRISHPQPAHA